MLCPDHEITIGIFREMANDQLFAMQVKSEGLIQSSPATKLGNWDQGTRRLLGT